jgi:hypothetical protein
VVATPLEASGGWLRRPVFIKHIIEDDYTAARFVIHFSDGTLVSYALTSGGWTFNVSMRRGVESAYRMYAGAVLVGLSSGDPRGNEPQRAAVSTEESEPVTASPTYSLINMRGPMDGDELLLSDAPVESCLCGLATESMVDFIESQVHNDLMRQSLFAMIPLQAFERLFSGLVIELSSLQSASATYKSKAEKSVELLRANGVSMQEMRAEIARLRAGGPPGLDKVRQDITAAVSRLKQHPAFKCDAISAPALASAWGGLEGDVSAAFSSKACVQETSLQSTPFARLAVKGASDTTVEVDGLHIPITSISTHFLTATDLPTDFVKERVAAGKVIAALEQLLVRTRRDADGLSDMVKDAHAHEAQFKRRAHDMIREKDTLIQNLKQQAKNAKTERKTLLGENKQLQARNEQLSAQLASLKDDASTERKTLLEDIKQLQARNEYLSTQLASCIDDADTCRETCAEMEADASELRDVCRALEDENMRLCDELARTEEARASERDMRLVSAEEAQTAAGHINVLTARLAEVRNSRDEDLRTADEQLESLKKQVSQLVVDGVIAAHSGKSLTEELQTTRTTLDSAQSEIKALHERVRDAGIALETERCATAEARRLCDEVRAQLEAAQKQVQSLEEEKGRANIVSKLTALDKERGHLPKPDGAQTVQCAETSEAAPVACSNPEHLLLLATNRELHDHIKAKGLEIAFAKKMLDKAGAAQSARAVQLQASVPYCNLNHEQSIQTLLKRVRSLEIEKAGVTTLYETLLQSCGAAGMYSSIPQ